MASTASLASVPHPSTFALLPLGAMLLAGSFGAMGQTLPADSSSTQTLPTVTVKEQAEPAEIEAKSTLRASDTALGKGRQALRDIPQSVTVMTEMLIDDRNLDDFREVLKTTAGVTFQAGETGEEDVRLRGFSLGQAGDIYVDGLRDAPLIERDTFAHDRVEVLKGSASMLFGKGSTGGVVNQVSKQPFLMNLHEVGLTLGTGRERRLTGDFNFKTGEDAALRVNVLSHDSDNYGAKNDRKGIASTFRWGIGLRDEFSIGLYHLETDGRPNYNHPWFLSNGTNGTIVPTVPARNYYGLSSDYLRTESSYATLTHTHRFSPQSELKTTLRHGRYERDLWASVIRFGTTGGAPTTPANFGSNTIITRTPKGRIAISDLTQLQSDFTNNFEALGKRHALIVGVDYSREEARRANNFAGAASGLTSTVGTPNDGASQADTRGAPAFNTFQAENIGLYLQDTVSLNDVFKLVGGLRHDRFKAAYQTAAATTFATTEGLWSPRVAALYQPHERASYYASYGTSYNVSGDTYQFTPGNPNAKDSRTPPEKSRNIEVGGKFEMFNNKASLGVAVFRAEKFNERNTDPDVAAVQNLLSGKRHATGMEFNLAGRITPKWEVFYNHTWIPSARIDKSNVALNPAGTGAQVQGDRPALTPRHSASLWTTYRVLPNVRLGAGVNYRGEQNPEGARHVTAAAFTTYDAMVEYTINDNLILKLNVTNLTDELYADSLYRGFYAPGAPRSVQLNLTATF